MTANNYVFDLSWCGRIKGMPEQYQPARLELWKREDPVRVQLVLSGKTVNVPPCLSRHFRLPKGEHMTVSGSWFHDRSLLPPYLNILLPQKTFPDGIHEGYSLLFNLETGDLIEMTKWEAGYAGGGMTGSKIEVTSICSPSEIEALKPRPAA